MTGVNIFGSGLTNKSQTSQRGPPGIGFKYLDEHGNFDIDNKRLGNVGICKDDRDAVSKIYADLEVKRIEEKFQKNHDELNLNLTENIKVASQKVEEKFQQMYDELNLNLAETSDNIDANKENIRVASEKIVEILGELENKVPKEQFNDIMNTTRRIIDQRISTVRTEVSSDIAKATDSFALIHSVRRNLEDTTSVIESLSNDIIVNKSELEIIKTQIAQINKKIEDQTDRVDNLVKSLIKENIEPYFEE